MYQSLTGSWQLHYSTFPMWHRKGVSNVTFNYTPTIEHGESVLKDEVKYLKNGKAKSLKGYDVPDEHDDTKYTWRGYGLLWLFTSKWRVEWMDESKECLIVSFSKTLATPDGVDILFRSKSATESQIQDALAAIKSKNLLQNVKEPLLQVA
jgi:hypothetical protein